VSRKQPPARDEPKKAEPPIATDMELRRGPVVTVQIGVAPPAPPEDRSIHPRRRLPTVPEAPSAPSKSADE